MKVDHVQFSRHKMERVTKIQNNEISILPTLQNSCETWNMNQPNHWIRDVNQKIKINWKIWEPRDSWLEHISQLPKKINVEKYHKTERQWKKPKEGIAGNGKRKWKNTNGKKLLISQPIAWRVDNVVLNIIKLCGGTFEYFQKWLT